MAKIDLPIIELDQMTEIFGYKNIRATRHAIRRGTFPIKTFKLVGRTVAHAGLVDAFFERMKAEGVAELGEKPAWDS